MTAPPSPRPRPTRRGIGFVSHNQPRIGMVEGWNRGMMGRPDRRSGPNWVRFAHLTLPNWVRFVHLTLLSCLTLETSNLKLLLKLGSFCTIGSPHAPSPRCPGLPKFGFVLHHHPFVGWAFLRQAQDRLSPDFFRIGFVSHNQPPVVPTAGAAKIGFVSHAQPQRGAPVPVRPGEIGFVLHDSHRMGMVE
jgi:hypothetical protein